MPSNYSKVDVCTSIYLEQRSIININFQIYFRPINTSPGIIAAADIGFLDLVRIHSHRLTHLSKSAWNGSAVQRVRVEMHRSWGCLLRWSVICAEANDDRLLLFPQLLPPLPRRVPSMVEVTCNVLVCNAYDIHRSPSPC